MVWSWHNMAVKGKKRKWQRNHIKCDFPSFTVTESHSPSIHHKCISSFPSVPPASMWAPCHLSPYSLLIWHLPWGPDDLFMSRRTIYWNTHTNHSSRLTCASALWGIQLWHLISQPDQITQSGITERMLHLWFTTPPFCMYSCVALQAANYGLILIIMDFVCSQQPLTVCTFYEPLGIWPISQKGYVNPSLTKKCIVTF